MTLLRVYRIAALLLALTCAVCWVAGAQDVEHVAADPLPWPVLLFVLLFSIVASFLFSGYETGFVQTNPIRIRYLAEEEKNPRAIQLMQYKHNPTALLATLLIGNNLVLIVGSMALTDLTGNDLAATMIALPLYLIFGETVPKSIFRVHPHRMTLSLLPVVRGAYYLLSPLTVPANLITRALVRVVGGPENPLRPTLSSVEEMRVLVDESAQQGSLHPEEQQMIHSVIDLQNKQAKEIMVPRIDIEALPITATRDELLALFEETGRTRILIYEDSIDQIIGVTNAYDVLLDETPDQPDIRRFVRDVLHVPDTVRVDDLLAALKREKQHLAVVIDEYGGTDGIVTIEDILEEIFGDIQDEHDTEASQIQQVGPRSYVVDARTYLEDASSALNVPLTHEDVETVGGWVMHVAGRIPVIGEVFHEQGIRVTVLDATVNAILRVRLEIVDERENDAGTGKRS